MAISLKGLSDEQKKQVKMIAKLGQMFGGTREMDNYLMGKMMEVYMPTSDPEEQKISDLSALYEQTQDEGVKQQLLDAYAAKTGTNIGTTTAENALTTKLLGEFPTDISNPTKMSENANMQDVINKNPKLSQQYYSSMPQNSYDWSSPVSLLGSAMQPNKETNIFGNETREQKIARLMRLAEQYKAQ